MKSKVQLESFPRQQNVRLVAYGVPSDTPCSAIHRYFADLLDGDDKMERVGYISQVGNAQDAHDLMPTYFSVERAADADAIVGKAASMKFNSNCDRPIRVKIVDDQRSNGVDSKEIGKSTPGAGSEAQIALCLKIDGEFQPLFTPAPIGAVNQEVMKKLMEAEQYGAFHNAEPFEVDSGFDSNLNSNSAGESVCANGTTNGTVGKAASYRPISAHAEHRAPPEEATPEAAEVAPPDSDSVGKSARENGTTKGTAGSAASSRSISPLVEHRSQSEQATPEPTVDTALKASHLRITPAVLLCKNRNIASLHTRVEEADPVPLYPPKASKETSGEESKVVAIGPSKKPKRGIWFDATITWIDSLQRVAVVDEKIMAAVDDLSERLDAFIGKDEAMRPDSAKVGDFVAAPFDTVYYRARIVDQNSDGYYDVLFLDYGNTSTVKFNELYTIPSEFCHLPAAALLVDLSTTIVGGRDLVHTSDIGVRVKPFNTGDKKCSVKLLARNDEPAEVVGGIIVCDGIDMRSLFFTDQAERFFDTAVPYDNAKRFPSATVKYVSDYSEKLRLIDITVGEAEHATSKEFASDLRKPLKALEEETGEENLKKWAVDHHLYIGELCLAPFPVGKSSTSGEKKFKYRRALIEDIDEAKSSVAVLFIDHGMVRQGITYASLRPLPAASFAKDYARTSMPIVVHVDDVLAYGGEENLATACKMLCREQIDVEITDTIDIVDGTKLFRASFKKAH